MSRPTDSLSSTFVAPSPAAVPAAAGSAGAASQGLGVGLACAAFGAIAFSGKAIIVKLGYRHGADAITLIGLRMAFALPFFAAMAVVAARRPGVVPVAPGDRWNIVALGVLGYYLASYLDFLGLAYVSASLERLILYLNPTIVLFIGLAFFGRRTNARQIFALVLGYGGVVLAFAHDLHIGGSDIVLGSVLVFGSALAYAIYLVGSGELVKRIGTLRLTAYASCVASFCCILHFALTRPLASLADVPLSVYGLSLINGTVCTVLPVFAVMASIQRIGASLAAQVGMIGPVSTIVLSDVLLGERMGVTQVIGTILVMIGVFVVSQGKAAPASRPGRETSKA
jgi:drug/metabolite transporter (DMT)-like permease